MIYYFHIKESIGMRKDDLIRQSYFNDIGAAIYSENLIRI